MKRFFIALTFAVFLALFSAPSLVKAEDIVVGRVCGNVNGAKFVVDALCIQNVNHIWYENTKIYNQNGNNIFYYYNGVKYRCDIYNTWGLYIPTIDNPNQYGDCLITNDETAFINHLPEELQPEETIWDDFYEMYKLIFGYYPMPGSFIDWLRSLTESDIDTPIYFPTNTPAPTPLPSPTPIPVQTIYVPDGNGNYTIIYQYPDPTSGVVTQSPYNPNDNQSVNVTVNCDCDGSDDKQKNREDPYYAPVDYFSWGSVDGDFTDSPAYTAGQSLDMIKATVENSDADMKVVANSFNFLPFKWLTLVGLLGACLIVAGLIRTFLGG